MSNSGPLAPRSGERVRERGLWPIAFAVAAAILSVAGCGGDSVQTDDNGNVTYQSPDDETGGYVMATVAAGMGTVRATIYDGSGNTEIASFVADAPGAPLSFWWTSASSQFTRITLRDEGGADYKYELTPNYVQVADNFEPNDAMDAAPPMPDGGQMSAYLFAGRRDGSTDIAGWDDNYRFVAQPGAALSIRMDDVPADLAARLFLFRPDGTEVARVASGLRGAPLALNVPTVMDSGDLIVRVSLWDEAPPMTGAGTEVPVSFKQPYRLTVSQTQP